MHSPRCVLIVTNTNVISNKYVIAYQMCNLHILSNTLHLYVALENVTLSVPGVVRACVRAWYNKIWNVRREEPSRAEGEIRIFMFSVCLLFTTIIIMVSPPPHCVIEMPPPSTDTANELIDYYYFRRTYTYACIRVLWAIISGQNDRRRRRRRYLLRTFTCRKRILLLPPIDDDRYRTFRLV